MTKPRGAKKAKNSHIWKREKDDWYIEDRWVSTRFFEIEHFEGVVWDPACGMGRIIKAARAARLRTHASDLRYRHFKCQVKDFFEFQSKDRRDNIASNPPFKFIDAFLAHALNLARRKVALIVPADWANGHQRSEWLDTTPLRAVYRLSPRPSMPPGHVIRAGQNSGQGTKDFCIAVWEHGYRGVPSLLSLRRVEKVIEYDGPSRYAG
jgi:hypothetical protein